MDIIRAKEIIATLAEGIDPITGEILPDDCVCNKAEVVRAFYAILNEKPLKSKGKSENAGKPWSSNDDALLSEMYKNGATKTEIQNHFKRSSGSIHSRLVRLGLINPD